MKVLICGGRDFSNYDFIKKHLDNLHKEHNITIIIHGAAKGADSLANKWANEAHVETAVFPAEWDKYGKLAGPIRNKRMIDEGKPDIVVAFPGGKGTANMIKQSKEHGIKVIEIKEE